MSSSPLDSKLDKKGGVIAVFEPTEEQRAEVRRLKALGIPLRQIRTRIINPETNKPVTVDTLIKYFEDERDAGECDANISVLGVLIAAALNGDMKAMTLWTNLFVKPLLDAEREMLNISVDNGASRFIDSVTDLLKQATKQKELEHEY